MKIFLSLHTLCSSSVLDSAGVWGDKCNIPPHLKTIWNSEQIRSLVLLSALCETCTVQLEWSIVWLFPYYHTWTQTRGKKSRSTWPRLHRNERDNGWWGSNARNEGTKKNQKMLKMFMLKIFGTCKHIIPFQATILKYHFQLCVWSF